VEESVDSPLREGDVREDVRVRVAPIA